VISRDVDLNEETRWDWKNQQEELLTKEVEVKLPVRDDGASSSRSSEEDSNSGSSDEAEAESRNPRFRDLRDLYETTGEVHLVCLLADAEMISFEETVRDPKWKATMDKKMKAIEKNETWKKALRLKKVLYGLKQAPRAWNTRRMVSNSVLSKWLSM
jgi:hypothetical protein